MATLQTILIADDEEINREILAQYFKTTYKVLLACNGQQAIDVLKTNKDVSIVLLDLIMPEMDGFEVLKQMHKMGLIGQVDPYGKIYNNVPVICITASNDEATMSKVFSLYADEFFGKPFSPVRIKNRVQKMIELSNYRRRSEKRINTQQELLAKQNDELMDTLSNLVEYRSQETGQHTKRIRIFSKILLTEYQKTHPELTQEQIELIAKASVLHDVGKQFVPEAILNAPRRLEPGEFEVIKKHSIDGYKIIENNFKNYDKDFINYAKQITLFHHERWDGKGYPCLGALKEHNINYKLKDNHDRSLQQGLEKDEIPLCAQVVSIADVYDALCGKRCYKKQIPHDKAARMILNGECGVFNPELMSCFVSCLPHFKEYGDSENLYDTKEA